MSDYEERMFAPLTLPKMIQSKNKSYFIQIYYFLNMNALFILFFVFFTKMLFYTLIFLLSNTYTNWNSNAIINFVGAVVTAVGCLVFFLTIIKIFLGAKWKVLPETVLDFE